MKTVLITVREIGEDHLPWVAASPQAPGWRALAKSRQEAIESAHEGLELYFSLPIRLVVGE